VLTYRITLTTDGIISAIAPQDEQSTESQSFTGLPEIGSRIEVDLGEELLIKFYDNGTVEVTPTPESP
jgi:flagellar basal body rod protein FlgF